MKYDNPLAIALLIVGFIFFLLGIIGSTSVQPGTNSGAMGIFYLTGGVAAIISGILVWSARSRR